MCYAGSQEVYRALEVPWSLGAGRELTGTLLRWDQTEPKMGPGCAARRMFRPRVCATILCPHISYLRPFGEVRASGRLSSALGT